MNKQSEILRISKKMGLTHIGSCLSVLPILEEIYKKKKPKDKVGLSGAHAHLAHLLVMGYNEAKTIKLIEKHGIHCDRKAGCDFSGGSLGHTGIALGMAIANPKLNIWWVITDGSSFEGSELEALRLKTDLNIKNLKVIANINGFTAVAKIDRNKLSRRLKVFCPDIDIRYTKNGDGFNNIGGHYKKL